MRWVVVVVFLLLSCAEKKPIVPPPGFYTVIDRFKKERAFKEDQYIVTVTNYSGRYDVSVSFDDFITSDIGKSCYFAGFYYVK